MNQIYCEDITLTPPRVRFADSSAEHSCCAEKSTKSIDLRQSQLLHRPILLQKKKRVHLERMEKEDRSSLSGVI